MTTSSRGIPLISKSIKGLISMDIYGKKPSSPPTHPDSEYTIGKSYNS
ncbi:hypothetical protein MYX76_14040 [Desulfobacterota bacterium AH_259_B03_O07]|nr:hypothetical protein [Desulfobacterota bacterium AH_259_B03_O07]